MADSVKTKKGKGGSKKEKDSPKSKGKKEKKENDDTKIEDLKSVILEDELWQSVIIIVVVESQRLHDSLLEQLNDLSTNFTVITPKQLLDVGNKESPSNRSRASSKTRKGSPSKESKKTAKSKNILDTGEKEPPGNKSRETSKTRKESPSKESKKTAKTKGAAGKKGSKQEKQNKDKPGDETNSVATCVLLKNYILELKNADCKEHINGCKKKEEEKKENNCVTNLASNDKLECSKENNPENRSNVLILRYIILWGFYDTNLLQECLNFNLLIKAVINIKDKCPLESSTEIKPVIEKKQKGKAKAKKSFEPRVLEEFSVFVEKLDENMKDEKFLEINKDVLFLNYLVEMCNQDVEEQTNMFKPNFLKILYVIREAWENFNKYNKSLIIQEVPDIQEILTLDDANLYTTMVSLVPPECTTVPVIIHSMLEQVCWWDEHILSKLEEPSEDTDLAMGNSLKTTDSITLSCSKFEEFCITITSSGTVVVTTLRSESSTPNVTPVLMDERDKIRRTTFHLHIPEINFQKITTDMLTSSPVYKLWLNFPLVPIPKLKWYEFHLQRFKKCAENCYFESDKLFTLYLHQSIMNVLTSKLDKLSVQKDDYLLNTEESDAYLLTTNRESTESNSIKSFIEGMLCNILCRVSKKCTNYCSSSKESSAFPSDTSFKESPDDIDSLSSVSSNWYEVKKPVMSKYRPLLDEKMNYRLMKINKLKSFLLCSEFVNLYEDIKKYRGHKNIDHMKRYEFIENLSVTCMCQSLQEAYENFINANYYYFPPSDTILLWFNNSDKKDLTLSRKIKGVLETPLGFRDYYKYKLGGKKNFEEMSEIESVSHVSGFSKIDNFIETSSSQQVSHSSHDSLSKVDQFPPTIVTNLGSVRIEHNECCDYFISADSTKVTVRKTKYFSNQMNISVSVNNNKTILCYNFFPDAPSTFVQIMIKMYNDIILNTRLTWSLPVTPQMQEELEITESKVNSATLSCDLRLTLPSGLLIEVVPTESTSIGPFYIRQSYLLKGPTCGKIWEETQRCYLKNGVILIFNSNNTVDILYNNGTTVRCNDFEWEKIVVENIPTEDENASKGNESEENKNEKRNEIFSDKSKKEGKGKGKNKEKKDDKKPESTSTSKKKKGKKVSKPEVIEENLDTEKDKKDEIYMYKIKQYSLLSWNGSFKDFNRGISNNDSNIHDLRIAFDKIDQELYIQRSDGMTCLFSPDEFSVLFPDGSKITSYTFDCREFNVENDTLVVVEDSTQGLGSSCEMESPSKDSESSSTSLEETSISNSSKSENDKFPVNEGNFVYVEMSYLFEHSNYASIKYVNKDCEVEISLPGNIVVYLDQNGLFTIYSDGNEKLTLTDSNLIFEARVLEESQQKTITTLNFKNVTTNPTVYCQTVDSLCNVFSVNEKGHTKLVKNGNNDSCSFIPLHPENVERYFVLNRDLTGYEMIKNCKINNKTNVETLKSPIIKNNDKLFTFYTQTPIVKNTSEQFLMTYIKEKHLPASMKRKDLLKLEETPKNIWFSPDLSKIHKEQSEIDSKISAEIAQQCKETVQQCTKTCSAMSIFKCSRIKNNINLSNWLSSAINEYMAMSERTVKQYLRHYPDETRSEKICAEGDLHKQKVLGSRSYYLTENLPKIVLDNLLEDQDKISIHSVSPSASSKTASCLEIIKQIK